jgi:xylan 1,4-beta-xylosidase
MTALVDVFLHIVMHYQEGWGGGNWTGQRSLRYVEIMNEPDSSCSWHARAGCGQFWNRSASDFYDLFDAIARAVKQYDPTLVVGGPGAALADEGGPGSPWPAKTPNPFSFGLIDAIATRRTPVDFISWHFYTDNTPLLTTIASAMRTKLDSVGLYSVEQHVTEWFTGMLNPSENSVGDAAAVAGILTKMVESNISLSTL